MTKWCTQWALLRQPKMFHDAEMKYYSMVLWARGAALAQTAAGSGFGCFDDPEGYNGFCP